MIVSQSYLRTLFSAHGDVEDFAAWRDHVLSAVIFASMILGVLVAVPSSLLALFEGVWPIALIDVMAVVWVVTLWLKRSLTYRVRAWNLCVLLYFLGLALLVTVGGISQIYLMAFPVMAALFLGYKPALFALAVNAVTLPATGYLTHADLQGMEFGVQPLLKWIVVSANFTLVSAVLTTSIVVIISGLQKTLARKHESEERYRTLTEWSPQPLAVHRGGMLLYANPAAVKMTGAESAQELIGKPILDWVHPDSRQSVLARVKDLTEHGGTAPMAEEKFLKVDGSTIDVEAQSAAIVFDGAPAIQVAMQDITERKRSQKQLIEAEAQYRSLVEQSIAGIYIVQGGKLSYVNARCAEIFGYAGADELIGLESLSVVADKDRDAFEAKVRQWLQGRSGTLSATVTAKRKDGSLIEVGINNSRATYLGRPATIGMIQDITDKKQNEEKIQRYVAQLEKAVKSTVEVATTLSEMRDPYTAGHERRVAELAVAIGAELGFDTARQEGLRVAGHLHDVGKMTIPAEILSKPGKLGALEFALIKTHAQSSYDVLKTVQWAWPVAEVALQHHERMDGSGYPQGLKGEAILLEARIMAVADVVEAMSSHRPYRSGLGIEAALAEIERGRANTYDAAVADVCLKLFREQGYTIPA